MPHLLDNSNRPPSWQSAYSRRSAVIIFICHWGTAPSVFKVIQIRCDEKCVKGVWSENSGICRHIVGNFSKTCALTGAARCCVGQLWQRRARNHLLPRINIYRLLPFSASSSRFLGISFKETILFCTLFYYIPVVHFIIQHMPPLLWYLICYNFLEILFLCDVCIRYYIHIRIYYNWKKKNLYKLRADGTINSL